MTRKTRDTHDLHAHMGGRVRRGAGVRPAETRTRHQRSDRVEKPASAIDGALQATAASAVASAFPDARELHQLPRDEGNGSVQQHDQVPHALKGIPMSPKFSILSTGAPLV